MQEQTLHAYQTVQRFTHELLDKKYYDMRELKEAQKACRAYIEQKLSKNSDIQKFLPLDLEQSNLIRELIVDSVLMKMSHHAALWETETYNPAKNTVSLTKEEQELYAKYDEICRNAFEGLKKDETLIDIVLRKLEKDFKIIFDSTLQIFFDKYFKDDPALQEFSNKYPLLCKQKIDDYRERFWQFAEGK